jgi:hypothetical protein
MHCPFPAEALKTVMSYLRRSGLAVVVSDGAFILQKGVLNVIVIEQACAEGAISLTDDGSIQVCGMLIVPEMDTVKIRRRVEDHLRKSASKKEIIHVAACLGIKLQ